VDKLPPSWDPFEWRSDTANHRRPRARKGRLGDLGTVPREFDVEVVLERERNRILQRQVQASGAQQRFERRSSTD
jgi:hypothetical protein